MQSKYQILKLIWGDILLCSLVVYKILITGKYVILFLRSTSNSPMWLSNSRYSNFAKKSQLYKTFDGFQSQDKTWLINTPYKALQVCVTTSPVSSHNRLSCLHSLGPSQRGLFFLKRTLCPPVPGPLRLLLSFLLASLRALRSEVLHWLITSSGRLLSHYKLS